MGYGYWLIAQLFFVQSGRNFIYNFRIALALRSCSLARIFELVHILIEHNWPKNGTHIGVLHSRHWLAVGIHERPLKSLITGPCLLGNCYLENKFHKNIRVNPR